MNPSFWLILLLIIAWKSFLKKNSSRVSTFNTIWASILFSGSCSKMQSWWSKFATKSSLRLIKSLYSVCVLAINILNHFYHHKSYLQYDRGYHAAASILIASKVIECSQKLGKIVAAYIKVIHGKDTMISHDKIETYRTPISLAEMNIIKVLNFDFNQIEPPYLLL